MKVLLDGTSVYYGDLENNRKVGNGTQVFNNGAVYTGQFENDQFSGQGVLVTEAREVFNGLFKNGIFVKQCTEQKMATQQQPQNVLTQLIINEVDINALNVVLINQGIQQQCKIIPSLEYDLLQPLSLQSNFQFPLQDQFQQNQINGETNETKLLNDLKTSQIIQTQETQNEESASHITFDLESDSESTQFLATQKLIQIHQNKIKWPFTIDQIQKVIGTIYKTKIINGEQVFTFKGNTQNLTDYCEFEVIEEQIELNEEKIEQDNQEQNQENMKQNKENRENDEIEKKIEVNKEKSQYKATEEDYQKLLTQLNREKALFISENHIYEPHTIEDIYNRIQERYTVLEINDLTIYAFEENTKIDNNILKLYCYFRRVTKNQNAQLSESEYQMLLDEMKTNQVLFIIESNIRGQFTIDDILQQTGLDYYEVFEFKDLVVYALAVNRRIENIAAIKSKCTDFKLMRKQSKPIENKISEQDYQNILYAMNSTWAIFVNQQEIKIGYTLQDIAEKIGVYEYESHEINGQIVYSFQLNHRVENIGSLKKYCEFKLVRKYNEKMF
ncbi:MORN_motif [Hexamita inflata]|uniref:MORN motif n=1 Tax=Hexamita inflata TaxID=28002 RepID=A0AA86NM82_9EUKA|nr:MORN motif [Hexamita inflata]